MRKSPTFALLLCATLLLAGCSSVTGLDGGAEPYSPAGESLNATQLRADHAENVATLDSFRFSVEQRTLHSNGSVSSEYFTSIAADRPANRTLVVSSAELPGRTVNTTRYVDGNRSFVRRSIGNQTSYRSDPGSDAGVNLTGTLRLANEWETIAGIDWTQNGTETFEGETVTRYSASGVETNADALGVRNASDLSSFEATLLVGSDGTVRLLTATVTGSGDDPLTSEARLELSGFDGTTVEEPDWLDRARNGTSA